MNPKALQYIMGHANIVMTLNYYAHAHSAQAVMERLEAKSETTGGEHRGNHGDQTIIQKIRKPARYGIKGEIPAKAGFFYILGKTFAH